MGNRSKHLQVTLLNLLYSLALDLALKAHTSLFLCFFLVLTIWFNTLNRDLSHVKFLENSQRNMALSHLTVVENDHSRVPVILLLHLVFGVDALPLNLSKYLL